MANVFAKPGRGCGANAAVKNVEMRETVDGRCAGRRDRRGRRRGVIVAESIFGC